MALAPVPLGMVGGGPIGLNIGVPPLMTPGGGPTHHLVSPLAPPGFKNFATNHHHHQHHQQQHSADGVDKNDLCKLLSHHGHLHHKRTPSPHQQSVAAAAAHSAHQVMLSLNAAATAVKSPQTCSVNPGLAWTNQILGSISSMTYPGPMMGMMGPPASGHAVHSSSGVTSNQHAMLGPSEAQGMLYGMLTGGGPAGGQGGVSGGAELTMGQNLTNLSVNMANLPNVNVHHGGGGGSPSGGPTAHHHHHLLSFQHAGGPGISTVISGGGSNGMMHQSSQQQQQPSSSMLNGITSAATLSPGNGLVMCPPLNIGTGGAGAGGCNGGIGSSMSSGSSTCSTSSLSPAGSCGSGSSVSSSCGAPLLLGQGSTGLPLNGGNNVLLNGTVVNAPPSSSSGTTNSAGATPGTGVVKEIIHCKSCTLFPPNPAAPAPTTRDKPPGCRTVFVGGLPENVTDEIIHEIFDRCGEITTVRMSKKNFCHIRFELEGFVENAIYFSGYRVRIGSNTDSANTGRLHVDYAQARDDLYEWECRERKQLRERRHRERIQQERLLPPSPPSVVHYSEHEAVNVAEKLKVDESFMKAVQVLITWMERGDCNKRTAGAFYTMIQSTNSHVRRLLTEKATYDEELQKAKDLMRQRMQGLLIQFSQIEKVFLAAVHKKAWDHFTKAQRKNIDVWKKQAAEIKNMQLEDALSERMDEEMDLSDSDLEEGGSEFPRGKRRRLDHEQDDNHKTVNHLKEENDSLRCQLEAFKNEVDLIKADLRTEVELKDQQILQLQKKLVENKKTKFEDSSVQCTEVMATEDSEREVQNIEQISITNVLAMDKTDEILETFEKTQVSVTTALAVELTPACESDSSGNSDSGDTDGCDCDSSSCNTNNNVDSETPTNGVTDNHYRCDAANNVVVGTSNDDVKITELEARLIGIISPFLHVHPFGASLDYVWSYTQKVIPPVTANQLENLMFKFPNLFRQKSSGIGATLERKWVFIGFL